MDDHFESSMKTSAAPSAEESNRNHKTTNVFLVAGEESANQYALRLIKKGSGLNIKYSGIGFPSLKEHGFEMIFDAKRLSVMGGVEVLKKYGTIKEAFNVSLNHIKAKKPDVVLLIDFGGFNLKLAKSIKKWNPQQKIYYFISPKFWAWRESRVERVKKWVDKMFVIHPFEVNFYKKHDYNFSEFVGHPLNQELKDDQFDLDLLSKKKKELGFNLEFPSLCLLFGSRESEISRLMPIFLQTADSILKKNKKLNIFTVVPPSWSIEDFKARVISINKELPIVYLQSPDPMDMMALADVALVASGTATLQLGLLEKPMAIGYKMNPISMFLAKKLVKGVKHAGLVNILSEKEVSKEFLQGELIVEDMQEYLEGLLYNKETYLKQKSDLKGLKESLGDKNPFEVINDEILKLN